MDLAEWCGWWWPFVGAVILTDKPTSLCRDDRGRLHNEHGPAIGYGDGWGVFAVHGVRVPRDVIEDRASITVDRIEAEKNAEIRRVMVELYGRERYVSDAKFKVEDRANDQHGRSMRLLSKRFEDGRELLFAELTNSSPETDGSYKIYHLGVHPEVRPILGNGQLGEPQKRTCRNAVASLHGLRGEEYAPIVET